MTTSHPEFETLAELANPTGSGGSGGSDGSAEVLAHVASCEQCSAEVAGLRGVRATLRALPPIAMPDAVASRIESALRAAAVEPGAVEPAAAEHAAAEHAAAVSVLPAKPSGADATTRWPAFHGLPRFSAAAAVAVLVAVALGVGVVAMVNQSGDSTKGSASSAAGESTGSAVVTTSGSDYLNGSIRNQVAALVLDRVPGSAARYAGLLPLATAEARPHAAPSSAAASAAGEQFATQPSAPAAASAAPAGAATPTATTAQTGRPAGADNAAAPPTAGASALLHAAPTVPGGPLASKAALQACVVALVDQPVTPILVDYALFNGQPATILVLPDPTAPTLLDIYVEYYTTPCVENGDVTFFATLPIGS